MTASLQLQYLSITHALDPIALTHDNIVLLPSIRHVPDGVKSIVYCPSNKTEFLFTYMTDRRMGAGVWLMDLTDRFASAYKQDDVVKSRPPATA